MLLTLLLEPSPLVRIPMMLLMADPLLMAPVAAELGSWPVSTPVAMLPRMLPMAPCWDC